MIRLKKFSIADWVRQFALSCRRFPVSVLLLIFLSCFLIFMNHGGKVGSKWEFFCIFYSASAALLGVSIQLLTEDFKSRWAKIITQFLVHAAWLAISLYLSQFDKFSLPQFIAVSATIVTIVLSVFVACFYRKGDDVPFWNFSGRTIVALIAGVVVGGVLTLGLILFAQSLDWLFGVEIKNYVFADIPSVCMVLLAPLLSMNLIPEGESKKLYELQPYSGFFKGVVQYLFIPLLLLYMVTLYVYATKILISWQLPVGWVSYLVTASMLGMVILLYLTYPLQHEQGNSIFKTFTRWLPLAMLPLLALMTVAIGRRLSDYGITVSRLYLLVFNLWCYAVCLWLIFTRNKRIWLIPASFAVILFLISVGPQSIPNVTQRQLLGEARKAFVASGITQLPISGEQYEKWLEDVDPKVAASIDSKLDYLQMEFGYKSTNDLLAKDAVTGNHAKLNRDGDVLETSTGGPSIFNNNWLVVGNTVPEGYSQMSLVDFYNEGPMKKSDGNRIIFKVSRSSVRGYFDGAEEQPQVEYQFEISAKQLIELDSQRNPEGVAEPLVIDNGEALLMISNYSFRIEDNKEYHINGEGILFTK